MTTIYRIRFTLARRATLRAYRALPIDFQPSARAVARLEARHARMERLRARYWALAA
jgi:hypothetical protein